MTDFNRIEDLCNQAGIDTGYFDIRGQWQTPAREALVALADLVQSPPAGSLGAPAQACHVPPWVGQGVRVFGWSVQLYALRSRRNWGIGDFGDLLALTELSARAGADFIGVNPLHTLFPDEPDAASPYSPSSRIGLNPIYLDIEALPDLQDCASARALLESQAFAERLRPLRDSRLVDYRAVAGIKQAVLRLIWQHRAPALRDPAHPRGQAFSRFRTGPGRALEGLARFQAIDNWLRTNGQANGSMRGWHGWPRVWQDPDSAEVARFVLEQGEAIDYQLWLQWQAYEQLATVCQRCQALGLRVGLYRDLAVGVDAAGAETWLRQPMFALGARVGAPPDAFNPSGQDWGLPPEIPSRMIDDGFEAYTELIRSNVQHAGALRIDHVMGLMRQFWIAPGMTAADGTYVRYPFAALTGIVARASARGNCLVIGEDLGLVPSEVRAAMQTLRILSYRPLYFEHHADRRWKQSAEFPVWALCTAATHDLPTLRGFWLGRDIEARASLGMFPDPHAHERAIAERVHDRRALLAVLHAEGLWGASADPVPADCPAGLALAVHTHLARSPCVLFALQPEDVFDELEQANLPGTTETQWPNWRRRLGLALEDWENDPRFVQTLGAVQSARAPRQTRS